MARISIEDCLENIENRFALVTIASHRTRQLMNGKTPFLKTKNKEAVTALREIAEGFIEGQQGYVKQDPMRGPTGLSGTAGTSSTAAATLSSAPVEAAAAPEAAALEAAATEAPAEAVAPEAVATAEAAPAETAEPVVAAPADAPAASEDSADEAVRTGAES